MADYILEIRENGNIVNPKGFTDFLLGLKASRWLITAKDIKKRSVPQNSYYWGVVVPAVRKGLYDAGFDEVRTNDQAHAIIKRYHLKKEIVSKDTGHILEQDGTTTELTPAEFNKFLDRVIRWAAEYLGIYIDSPNDQMKAYKDWQEFNS